MAILLKQMFCSVWGFLFFFIFVGGRGKSIVSSVGRTAEITEQVIKVFLHCLFCVLMYHTGHTT